MDYNFTVPLNYNQKEGREISIFAREILNEKHEGKPLPYLIFFQGGPGYESPRPLTNSGWIQRASEDYKVLLNLRKLKKSICKLLFLSSNSFLRSKYVYI